MWDARCLLLFPLLLLPSCASGFTRKVTITIPEEQPVGTHVANIMAVGELDSIMSATERQKAKFQYFSSSPAERFFSLNSRSGKLTIRRPIDRDNLCDSVPTCCPQKDCNDASCVLNLSVRSDDEYRYVLLIRIIVTDVNDNSPAWPEAELTVHFSEASGIGELRSLKVAKDPDCGSYSVQRYEMIPLMPQFSLELYKSKTPLAVSAQLKLKLTSLLDREEKSSYEFRLVAIDGGNPERSGTVKVSVFVTDENDNKPVFEKSLYTAHLDENSPRYSSVIRVKAEDQDSGANGQVRYSFSTLTKPKFRRAFTIDSVTGLIRVQGDIDYERSHEMTLYVEAVDQGLTSRTGMATVSVRIHDENDHRPEIKVESSKAGGLSEVNEEEKNTALLAVFTVVDEDSGVNGRISCKASDQSNGDVRYGLEKMNIPLTNMYKVLALSRVDREVTPYLRIGVLCSDAGIPPQSTTMTLTVRVVDINDHTPDFGRKVFHKEVREDHRPGDTLFMANATDPDEGKNGQLEYWISSNERRSPFAIQRSSGQIYLQYALDRETQEHHSFMVFARDHGKPTRLTSSATYSVRVLDANDNRPQVDDFIYVSVPENQTTGEVITQINATDADVDANAEMIFSMSSLDSATSGFFHLSTSGQLVLLRRGLDREKQAKFGFLVTVTNTAPPQLSSTATLVVTILDINDCSPQFRFPTAFNNSLTVWTSQRGGTVVAKVEATDGDADDNGRVFYHIRLPVISAAAHTITSLFRLDATSGDLSLVRDLTPDDSRLYHVLIEARDNGIPSMVSLEVLKIQIAHGFPGDSSSNQVGMRGRTNDNFIIIVVLVSVTGVCASILIVAIIVLLHRRNKGPMKDRRLCGAQNTEEERQKWRMDVMSGHLYTATTVDSRGSIAEEMEGVSPTYVSFINHDQLSLTSFDNSNDSGKGGSVDNNCQNTAKEESSCPGKSGGILKFQTFKESSDHIEQRPRPNDLTTREGACPYLLSPGTVSRGSRGPSEDQRASFRSSGSTSRTNTCDLSPICEQPASDACRLDNYRHLNGSYHECSRQRTEGEDTELSASFV